MTAPAAHSSQTTSKPFHPDSTLIEADQVVPDALYLTSTELRGEITNDDAAIKIGLVNDDAASTVRELEEIPLSETQTDECTIFTTTVAALQETSRAQYETKLFGDVLAQSISRSIVRRADQVLLTDYAESIGLLAAAGTTQAVVGTDLFTLSDLDAELATLGAEVEELVMAPKTWAKLQRIVKATGSNESLLGLGTDQTERRLLSHPVRLNSAVPVGAGLFVDRTTIASAYSPVRADVSFDSGFSRIAVAVRGDWRVGHNLTRPARLGVFYISGMEATTPVDLTGVTGGTYKLVFRGKPTAALAFDANAATIKTALTDIGVVAADVTVTGSAGAWSVKHPAGVLAVDRSQLT